VLPDLTVVAAQAVKGVVNISSVQLIRRPNSPFANDPFFEYFFGGRDDVFGSRDQLARSLGSGVLVSADGYVVTNSHVIGSEKADVTVIFSDNHEAPARIVGIDKATDLALVKVDKPGQPPLKWGDSSQAKVAEWVLAIGSPYQLSHSVSLGIISALGRKNLGFSEYEDFIQTDAAINRGNSGGALVSARGELIGINTGIFSSGQNGGSEGIGFAIPSNLARRIIDEIIDHGIVRRGSLGRMSLYPLTTQMAAQLGVRSTAGAFVNEIDRRSPAYQAGLEPGDIIVSFNGQTVVDPAHFLRLSSDAAIGSTATVGVIRDGRQVTLKIPGFQREA
jgi:S1-C subfamily serine protease